MYHQAHAMLRLGLCHVLIQPLPRGAHPTATRSRLINWRAYRRESSCKHATIPHAIPHRG
jgi:hypothetical protein